MAPRIFVQIASYRDPECGPTIADLFERAAGPERVTVGLCWQYDPAHEPAEYVDPRRPAQVRTVAFPVDACRGVCWARRQTQLLYRGEEYTLVVDSHSRFADGWDELLIDELARCDSPKPLLSCNPASYTPPRALQPGARPGVRRPHPFTPAGDMRCRGEVLERAPERPLRGAFVAAGFMFSRGAVIDEVPYDPHLYFNQEEVAYAVRLFTHGWDVFSASRVIVYHYYRRAGDEPPRPLHWRDRPEWKDLEARARRRFDHLTGFRASDDPEVLVDLDRYGLGRARSLDEFERWTGVDFRRKHVSERGLRCRFIEGLERYRRPITIPEIDGPPKRGRPAPDPRALALPAGPAPGDFLPFFELRDLHDRPHDTHRLSGRPAVLSHLADLDDDDVVEFFALWDAFGPEIDDSAAVVVLPRPAAALRALRARLGADRPLYADPERTVARRLRLDAHRPTTVVLDENGRVAAAYCPGHTGAALALASDECRRLGLAPAPAPIGRHAPVLRVPGVLTLRECGALIGCWVHGERFEGKVGTGEQVAYRRDAKIRTDCQLPAEWIRAVDAILVRRLLPEIDKVYGLLVTHREEYKIGRYAAEAGGFFSPHRDNFHPDLTHRRFALTLNLNEGFAGGGLNFPEYGTGYYQAAAGEAIVFPSSLVHQVLPVTHGQRFTLVSFLYGESDAAYEDARRRACGRRGVDALRRIERDAPPDRAARRSLHRFRR